MISGICGFENLEIWRCLRVKSPPCAVGCEVAKGVGGCFLDLTPRPPLLRKRGGSETLIIFLEKTRIYANYKNICRSKFPLRGLGGYVPHRLDSSLSHTSRSATFWHLQK